MAKRCFTFAIVSRLYPTPIFELSPIGLIIAIKRLGWLYTPDFAHPVLPAVGSQLEKRMLIGQLKIQLRYRILKMISRLVGINHSGLNVCVAH